MTTVLSFDCGVNNLAWCLYDVTNDVILDWQVKSLQKNIKRDLLCEHVISKLDEWGFNTIADLLPMSYERNAYLHVVIENQPYRNAACKIIEVTLQSYFVMRGKMNDGYGINVKNVCTISPRDKLQGHAGGARKPFKKGAKGYKLRKERGIDVVDALPCLDKSTRWKEYFDGLKKQDDAADSLLQALAYASSIQQCKSFENVVEDNCETRIIAKKPTKSTELTDANCKWLLKQILYPRTRKLRIGAFQRLSSEIEHHKNPGLKQKMTELEKTHGGVNDVLRYLGLIR